MESPKFNLRNLHNIYHTNEPRSPPAILIYPGPSSVVHIKQAHSHLSTFNLVHLEACNKVHV